MKTFIKPTVVYVSLFILLNSCSVYYEKEVSFEEAYQSRKPARLITNENKKIHFEKIILRDTTYYGIYKNNGELVSVPLSIETQKSLRIKNKEATTILNVSGSLLTLGILKLAFFPSWQ